MKIKNPSMILGIIVLTILLAGGIFTAIVVNNNKKTKTEDKTNEPVPTIAPGTSFDLKLNTQNNSNISGSVKVTDDNGKAKINVALDNADKSVELPAYIKRGACSEDKPALFVLNNIKDGASETRLTVSVNSIISQYPLSVNIQKSLEDTKTIVACIEIKP